MLDGQKAESSSPTDIGADAPILTKAVITIQRLFRAFKMRKMLRVTGNNAKELLDWTQSRLDSKNLYLLDAYPREPQKATIDKNAVNLYLTQIHDPKLRQSSKKIIDHHIQYVSFDKFLAALKDAVFDLNKYLVNHHHDDCISVGIAKGRSQEWVANLAMRFMANLPEEIIKLDGHNFAPLEPIPLNGKKSRTLIMYDDCSYTGTQLESMVINNLIMNFYNEVETHFGEAIWEFTKKHIEANTLIKKAIPSLNVILVIPFVTTTVINRIKEKQLLFEENNYPINLKLFYSRIIPLVKQLPVGVDVLEDFCELTQINKDHNKVLFYGDWKLPDFVSAPYLFSNGYFRNDVQHHFLPRIVRPYRNDEKPSLITQVPQIPSVFSPEIERTRRTTNIPNITRSWFIDRDFARLDQLRNAYIRLECRLRDYEMQLMYVYEYASEIREDINGIKPHSHHHGMMLCEEMLNIVYDEMHKTIQAAVNLSIGEYPDCPYFVCIYTFHDGEPEAMFDNLGRRQDFAERANQVLKTLYNSLQRYFDEVARTVTEKSAELTIQLTRKSDNNTSQASSSNLSASSSIDTNEDNWISYRKAMERGDSKKLNELLMKDDSLLRSFESYYTPFQKAIMRDQQDVARRFLDMPAHVIERKVMNFARWAKSIYDRLRFGQGAAIHNSNYHLNLSDLHLAAKFGQKELVLELIRRGDNPNAIDTIFHDNSISRYTPIDLAVLGDHLDTLATLLEHGATSFNSTLKSNPLDLALRSHNMEIINLLKQYDAKTNKSDSGFQKTTAKIPTAKW